MAPSPESDDDVAREDAVTIPASIDPLLTAIIRTKTAATDAAKTSLNAKPPLHAIDRHAPTVAASVPTTGRADLDREILVLATVIASEIGGGTVTERTGVAWAVRQSAVKRNQTLSVMMGTLGRHQVGNNPPFSSAQPPSKADIALATQVMNQPLSASPVPGADDNFEAALQDYAFEQGEGYRRAIATNTTPTAEQIRFQHYRSNAAAVVAKRARHDEVVLYNLSTAGSKKGVVLFGPKGATTATGFLTAAVSALTDKVISAGEARVFGAALGDLTGLNRAYSAEIQTRKEHLKAQGAFQAVAADGTALSAAGLELAHAEFQIRQPIIKDAVTFDFTTGLWKDGKPT